MQPLKFSYWTADLLNFELGQLNQFNEWERHGSHFFYQDEKGGPTTSNNLASLN